MERLAKSCRSLVAFCHCPDHRPCLCFSIRGLVQRARSLDNCLRSIGPTGTVDLGVACALEGTWEAWETWRLDYGRIRFEANANYERQRENKTKQVELTKRGGTGPNGVVP